MPSARRSLWLALKYTLAAFGAWCILYLAVIELRERRVGLGLGVVVVAIYQAVQYLSQRYRA